MENNSSNPGHSMILNILYSHFTAQGCRTETSSVCGCRTMVKGENVQSSSPTFQRVCIPFSLESDLGSELYKST